MRGAGIYRHVWLIKTSPLAVAPDGVFVHSRFADATASGPADVVMQASLSNAAAEAADASVSWEVLDPDGKTVARASASGSAGPASEVTLEKTAKVESPRLWTPESPSLYRLVTTVSSGGRVVDRVETAFGLRTFGFDANRGFLLNGKPYPLNGTSNHQDHAGLGSALPDALQYFRIARLKEMGCNLIRSAHNPAAPHNPHKSAPAHFPADSKTKAPAPPPPKPPPQPHLTPG